MHKRLILAVALLPLLAATPASAQESELGMLPDDDLTSQSELVGFFPDQRCGTVDFGPVENPRAPLDLDAWVLKHGAEKVAVSIPVAVHVLWYTNQRGIPVGVVTDEQIGAQIDVLNAAYAGSGVSFYLARIDTTENRFWAKAHPGSLGEREMKEALAVDPAHTFNLYVTAPSGLLLGWAVFPWSYPEDSIMHGVVIHYGTLPGGHLATYNAGDTATHEIGHYLGLYHTFQGGCTQPNDYCEDTPQEASPDYYCTIGRDSCPLDPGLDPIHNFMDYTPDSCMYEFTSDQAARLDWALTTYRPSLISSKAEGDIIASPAASRTGITSVAPNPFNPKAEISFTLRAAGMVSLNVYDLAGRRIRTLLEQDMAAGPHDVAFDGRGLPSSVYFVVLKANGEQSTQRVMLLK